MKIIIVLFLFITANSAAAQIPRDVHERPRDKSLRDKVYEPRITKENSGKSDTYQEIPFRNGQEIPENEFYMQEIKKEIVKCNYHRDTILARLKRLENKCTDITTKHACIVTARRMYLRILIDKCK